MNSALCMSLAPIMRELGVTLIDWLYERTERPALRYGAAQQQQ